MTSSSRPDRPATDSPPDSTRGNDLATPVALIVALLAVALAWASRGSLNVDGVAYLNLADRLRALDPSGFVQGYWSPAYPALLALTTALLGVDHAEAAAWAHLLNLVIALVAIALTWRLARRWQNATATRLLFVALLVASTRTLRIDAVTPDLLLLAVMIGAAGELLRPGGFRPVRLGLWAGASFWVKTSVWPWLLVSTITALIVRRRDHQMLRRIGRSALVAGGLMALWIVPMSYDAGAPTIGDTGRYGFGWYLQLADSRSPDSHRGQHQNYATVLVDTTDAVRIATFPDARWTWAPWSDPSAWQRGIISDHRTPIDPAAAAWYWLRLLGLTLSIWALPVLLLVIVPLLLQARWSRPPPAATALIVAGVLGTLQFIAVHAEPRLIAPFLMLSAIGVIAWRTPSQPGPLLRGVSWLGLMAALVIGGLHIPDQLKVTASTAQRMATLPKRTGADSIVVVIGPAFPLMPDLYRAGRHAVAQIFAPPPDQILGWPTARQNRVAELIRSTGTRTVWISRGRDGYRIVELPE